ncbi:hypothetical protein [Caballeronia sp. ATUFL_M2_KS44]|uniref:hypothetical protein n=1 Tax=Caballeronia sp. ATUFL_M2_KS44 TaxID=2921767 RepID=UPI002027FF60|nr:hypothetical protein [Caballeronia sp. ATUFL_M2_KS44]
MPEIHLTPLHAGQLNILANRSKRTVVRCGRRYGKTTMFEQLASTWALKGKRVGFFAPSYKLWLPTYQRIHKSLAPAISQASKVDAVLDLHTGGAIEFWTLSDPDAGRSRFYDEVIVDEASLVPGLQDIFEQSIAPTLLDRNGNALMGGTPKGQDPESYFYQACTNAELPEPWREFHAPTAANPKLNAAAVAALQAKNHPLVWRQEYQAEFVDWSGTAFFSLENLLRDGKGVGLPMYCDYVFCVVDSALKTGLQHDGTAVVWCAFNSLIPDNPRITILDWEITQIQSNLLTSWLPGVLEHGQRIAIDCKARHGFGGAFIEDKASGITLLQHGKSAGWPVHAIDGHITSQGKDARAVLAAGPVLRGDVKLSAHAADKQMNYKGVTRNHLISQLCGYVLGDPDAHKRSDDLFDCAVYSVIVACGDSEGF